MKKSMLFDSLYGKPLTRRFLNFLCCFFLLTGFLEAQGTEDCNSPATYTIPLLSTVKISNLLPGASSAYGIVIFISKGGKLEIDVPFTFINCTIRGGSNTSLVTTSGIGTQFIAISSAFTGCQGTWGGITVSPNTNISFQYCLITNAVAGITFPAGYNSNNNVLTNTVFTGNGYSINVGFSGKATVGFAQCFGNRMSGGIDGVVVKAGSNLKFGTYGGKLNQITDVQRGITGEGGTTISIVNTHCSQTILNPISASTGFGIYFTGVNLSVEPPSAQTGTGGCVFSNNPKGGIYVQSASGIVSIQKALFYGNQNYGIHLVGGLLPFTFTISGNTFFHTSGGSISSILINRPPSNGLQNSFINNNTISAAPDPDHPCKLQSFIDIRGNAGAKAKLLIEQNVINSSVNDCGLTDDFKTLNNGILVQGNGDAVITSKQNVINYSAGPENGHLYSNFGIAYVNMPGEGHSIENNKVTSVLTPSGNESYIGQSVIQCGIHVTEVNEPFICDNEVNNTYRGFHLGGNLSGCNFSLNNMHRHVYGLYCWGDAVKTNIDDQRQKENTWDTDAASYVSGGKGARYADGTPPFKFYVDYSKPGHVPPNALPALPVWFPDDVGPANACTRGTAPQGPRFYESDTAVAVNNYPSIYPAGAWDARRRLWTKLIRHPDWVASNSVMQAFYNMNIGSSEQRFAEAFYLLGEAVATPSNLLQQWQSIQSQISVTMSEITRLDSLLGLDTININQSYLLHLAQQMHIQDSLSLSLEGIVQNYILYRDQQLQQLAIIADQLPSSQIYEQAWKTILTAYIQQYLGNELSAQQRNDLMAIAQSCPSDAGEAVTSVPACMPVEDGYPYIGLENFSSCNRAAWKASDIRANLTVTPNPAADQILVKFPCFDDGKWSIYTSAGKSIRSGMISKDLEQHLISLSDMPSGLYFLSVQCKEKTETTRFEIIK